MCTESNNLLRIAVLAMVFVQVTSHARYVYSKPKETWTFFVLHSKACH